MRNFKILFGSKYLSKCSEFTNLSLRPLPGLSLCMSRGSNQLWLSNSSACGGTQETQERKRSVLQTLNLVQRSHAHCAGIGSSVESYRQRERG